MHDINLAAIAAAREPLRRTSIVAEHHPLANCLARIAIGVDERRVPDEAGPRPR